MHHPGDFSKYHITTAVTHDGTLKQHLVRFQPDVCLTAAVLILAHRSLIYVLVPALNLLSRFIEMFF